MSSEIFTARGTQVLEANFLTIYAKYMAVEEKTLPGFEDGEELTPSQLTLDEGKTTAPSLLNESDLIGLMDKNEIGTDATIHEHVKTIQDRNYVEKKNNLFYPTQLGLALLLAYDDIGLNFNNPFLRATTEK